MTTATATSNNNNNTSTTNLAYTVAAYGLALVKSCQVLAEMLSNIVDGSRSDGYEWGRYRWSTVIGIELIKYLSKKSGGG